MTSEVIALAVAQVHTVGDDDDDNEEEEVVVEKSDVAAPCGMMARFLAAQTDSIEMHCLQFPEGGNENSAAAAAAAAAAVRNSLAVRLAGIHQLLSLK